MPPFKRISRINTDDIWNSSLAASQCKLRYLELINIAIRDRRRTGISRPKKYNPKTDMTPMVDLGFLLISFFVMTTELSKPRIAPLNMPKEGPPIPVGTPMLLAFY